MTIETLLAALDSADVTHTAPQFVERDADDGDMYATTEEHTQ